MIVDEAVVKRRMNVARVLATRIHWQVVAAARTVIVDHCVGT